MAERHRITVKHVSDGDTVTVDIEISHLFKTWLHGVKLRLAGINCDEIATPSGLEAYRYLASLFAGLEPGDRSCIAEITGPDKYSGRWNAYVYMGVDPVSVNEKLVQAGHAVRWDGRGLKPVFKTEHLGFIDDIAVETSD